MPISFYSMDESRPREGIAWLCDQNWNIAEQVDYLSDWLKQIEGKIEKGSYVADIGFVTRRDASGGGAVINTEMVRIMNDLGIELFLSEYGCESEDADTESEFDR